MAGLPLTADFNGTRQDGAGLYSFAPARGQRVTAEGACLNPVRHRANLQDHLDVTLGYKAKTTAPYGISWPALARNVGHVLDWLIRRRGRFAPTTGGDRPDVQLFFCAGVANTQNASGFTGHGFLLHVCEVRPGSLGRLRLKSADPAEKPEILFNLQRDNSRTRPCARGPSSPARS